jgi:3-methyladenine DNA glycosylase AlkD
MKDQLIAELEKEIQPDKVETFAPYFGVAPGKYGEGDILLAIHTPNLRKICKKYKEMPENEIVELLRSPVHDYRFAGLVLLREQFKKFGDKSKDLYLANLESVNNWDLVDESAPNILGRWCYERKDENILADLHNHKDKLWHKRIAVVAYLYFYRKKTLGNGLEIIDDSLEDSHPLIQKACGWMLHNIYAKVDKHLVESYIIGNYDRMSRNTLRAAIERMPEEQRLQFLHREF